MANILAIDNPLNGYVDGHCDGEDLGVFLLSPLAMKSTNGQPRMERVMQISEFGNLFDEGSYWFLSSKGV